MWRSNRGPMLCGSCLPRGIFCCDIILLVIGTMAFLSFLGMATLFHADTSFQKTTCNVVDVNTTQWIPCHYCENSRVRTCTLDQFHRRTCTSRRRCYDSRFPCAKIQVSYEITDERKITSHLKRTAFNNQGLYQQCAVNVCMRDETANQMRVESFTTLWVKNSNVTCYYHEETPTNVIANKIWSSTGKAAKAAALPCLIALGSFGLVIFRVYRWRKQNNRQQEYQGVQGGSKIFTGTVLAPPPGQQQAPVMGPGYAMQPMPPQPTYPPPHMPPASPAYQPYPPAGPPPQAYPGYQDGTFAPPPPSGAYPPLSGGPHSGPYPTQPAPAYNPELQPAVMAPMSGADGFNQPPPYPPKV